MNGLADSLRTIAASEEALVAAAWLARNLIGREGLPVAAACARLRQLAVDAEAPAPLGAAGEDRAFYRALAILCEVWSGDREDPTGGATKAHHHLQSPLWAASSRPTALIGPWIFYRAD